MGITTGVDVDAATGAAVKVGRATAGALDLGTIGCAACTLVEGKLFCIGGVATDVEAVGCKVCILDGFFEADRAVGLKAKSDACRFGCGSITGDDKTSGLGRFSARKRSRARCALSACLGVRTNGEAWFVFETRGELVNEGGGPLADKDEGDDLGETLEGGGSGNCTEFVLFLAASVAG
jgi:hypothetical protein